MDGEYKASEYPSPPPSLSHTGETATSSSDRPLTPSTNSLFSISTSMQSAILREDAGRKYQATTDMYALPADELEKERLNQQHPALKKLQGDSNYLAPFKEVLKPVEGEEKRLIDLGCGTGIWAIEMAQEFPHVDCWGVDIVPLQIDENLPENCHFAFEDCSEKLGYPDAYFDAVHSRLMTAGLRDWPRYISEVVRITKPGGLICFVEACDDFGVSSPPNGPKNLERGWCLWASLVAKAMKTRGLLMDAGSVIVPETLRANDQLERIEVVRTDFIVWAWSDDPRLKEVGEMMIPDAKLVPGAFILVVCDALSVTEEEYAKVAAEFLQDIGSKDIKAILPMNHVWAFKKKEA